MPSAATSEIHLNRPRAIATLGTALLAFFLVAMALGPARAAASAGSLVRSFGQGGRVTTPVGGSDSIVFGVAVQPNGRIVAVGADPDTDSKGGMLIARYLANGRLDGSFGGDGRVQVSFKSGSAAALDVGFAPSGRILVAGAVNASRGLKRNFVLLRLRLDGRLDPSFARGGRAVTKFPGGEAEASALALQRRRGRIVLAGQMNNASDQTAFALAGYRLNGRLDRRFGKGGKVTTGFAGGSAEAADVIVRRNGRIVATGAGREAQYYAFAQYLPNGKLDKSFGKNGRVDAEVGDPFANLVGASSLALQGKRIVAAGTSKLSFALTRLRPGGAQDRSFGSAGTVFTKFLPNGTNCNAMALARNGQMVVAGGTSSTGSAGFALARYRRSGPLDHGFGNAGKVTTIFPGAEAAAQAVALAPNGEIIVAGGAKRGSADGTFALARYRSHD